MNLLQQSAKIWQEIIEYRYVFTYGFFIIKANPQGDLKCDFLCYSIFEKGERDYEINQRSRTLLKKERIHIPSNTTDILLDRLTTPK